MGKQTITKTFVGTSDPVTLEYSQSYYGPKMISAEKTTIGESAIFFDTSKKFGLGEKISAKCTFNWTAGIALPSWAASVTVEEGEISADEMTIRVSENTLMGGMLLGVQFDIGFSFVTEQWILAHEWHKGWKPHWVSAHWKDLLNQSHNIHFDLIPMGVDLIVTLVRMIPGLKKLLAIIPTGLLDHMQDYKNGITAEKGVFLDPEIPMKWDIIYIARQIAEVGVDVGSNVFTPAAAAAVTALTSVGEAMISLEEEVGISLGAGPQIDLVFPLRIKITELVADDVVFETVAFDGATITGTNPNRTLVVDEYNAVTRIGFQCEQTLELMDINFGLWCKMTAFKVLSVSGDKQFNLIQLLEEKLDFDLSLGQFKSSMTNEIGASGFDDSHELIRPPSTVEVKFI